MKKYQRVAALIDLDAIEENFEAMRAGLPAGTKMAAVVKANGYGHGAVPIARLLESKDAVWGFAAAISVIFLIAAMVLTNLDKFYRRWEKRRKKRQIREMQRIGE